MRHLLMAALAVAPYVQAGTPTSMVVIWQSASPVAGTLQLLDGGRPIRELHDAPGTHHQFKLDGLKPGASYGYRALEGTREAGHGTFHANNGSDQTRFRFAVVGDSGSGNANQFAVARQILAWKPDFVLHTGDVVYEGGAERDYQPKFVEPYRQLIANTVMYPTLGNHDYRTRSGSPYLAFFELPHAGQERWYSFNYGHALFIGLDSNARFGPGSEQYTWLKATLAGSTARWKMAYFHHPFYSSGWEGSSPWLRETWGPLFKQYGVNVVFNGHDHDYERIKPMDKIQFIVTGGGGASLRKMKWSPFTAAERVTYHFVGVQVDGDHLTGEAIDAKGLTFDRWDLTR
jgi:hypothetical protein